MNINIKTLTLDNRIRLFWSLTFVFFLSLSIYGYGVLSTIHHAVAKKAMAANESELIEKVSELEFKVIALKNDVDLELAISKGFVEVKSPIYISRIKSSLTLNTEGR